MALERTATLTMRRALEQARGTAEPEDWNLGAESTLFNKAMFYPQRAESAAYPSEGNLPVDVSSFPDALEAACIFYGIQGPFRIVYVGGSTLETDADKEQSTGEAQDLANPRERHRKIRHPLVTWIMATAGIMWLSIRHPGKPAWVDHDTGEVWVAD